MRVGKNRGVTILAKYKKKENKYDCYFFEIDHPENWPVNVRENAKSTTGYSYGTLDYIDDKNGGLTRDGIELKNNTWIVIENGYPFLCDDNTFNLFFESELII